MPGSVKEGHELSVVTAVYKFSAFINREEIQEFCLENSILTAARNQILLALLMLTVPLKSV